MIQRAREGHTQGLDLVNGGIRAVKRAGGGVGAGFEAGFGEVGDQFERKGHGGEFPVFSVQCSVIGRWSAVGRDYTAKRVNTNLVKYESVIDLS
ncbi:MAG: hypothetical protein ABIG63_10280 [Chloroflexota bacterium]